MSDSLLFICLEEGKDRLRANRNPEGPETWCGGPRPPLRPSRMALGLGARSPVGSLGMLSQPGAAGKGPRAEDCPARGSSEGCERDGGGGCRGGPGGTPRHPTHLHEPLLVLSSGAQVEKSSG